MADSLFSILTHKDYDEPPEIVAIKQYMTAHFQEDAEVVVREQEIILTVASAPLASTLRFHVRQLQQAADTKKRIILRLR